MKSTLDINDRLLLEAKSLAAQQRTTLTRIIEEGLQLRLRTQQTPGGPSLEIRLPVFDGQYGVVANVDPLSNKSMLQALGEGA